jgi:hypothetical protein
MLDHFGRAELEELIASEGGPHLTVYLPTHTSAAESQQDVIRFKNIVRDAEVQLSDGWMRRSEVDDFLAPLTELIHDERFWAQRQRGLAIFLEQGKLRTYRLGTPFQERLSIRREYLTRPIVAELHRRIRAFVLALSEHKVALYELDDAVIRQIEVADMPLNMETTLNLTSVDRGQQMHTGASGRIGKGSQVFHGQGGKPDSHREDLRHFFRAVDQAVVSKIGDSNDPLVLACVDSSVSTYREVNSYKKLHSDHLSGNFDYSSPQELQAKALPVLQNLQANHRQEFMHKIRDHLHTRTASANASEVIRAAFQGRVATLFFDEEAVVEGQFDPILQAAVVYSKDSDVELNALNTDLVEMTLRQTLLHKGEVFSVSQSEMPEGASMAALFRY